METLLYLLRVNIAFILLYGIFHLFLRNAPHFAANRAWLLLTPIAAFLLPLMQLPASASLPAVIELAPLTIGITGNASLGTPSTLTPERVLSAIYLGGVLLSLIILTIRYVLAWRSSHRTGDEALSFFGRIVIPADVHGDEERSLLAHERVHASHGHSFDVLFYELLAALSWWNPLWRLALRELRTLHELQADAVASTFHSDYGHLLLSRALGVPTSTLVNSFRSSNLKTRITMLNKTGSRFSGLKYALAVPALFVALVAVSSARPDVPSAPPIPPMPPVPPAAPAPPAQTDPTMDLSQVDVQPEFPGGMEAMYAYMLNTVQYPEQAAKDKLEGKVYVQFIVGSDGKVEDVTLRHGVRHDIDTEAMRSVASMPNWTPGQKDGHAVATRFIIPVVFALKKAEAPAKD